MKNDRYVTEQEMEAIKSEYARKIVMFTQVQEDIEKWYKDHGLTYPDSCINNFRDSWHHYRKIWTEHSLIEINRQASTLDEHLQRAEKDAIVNFFQIVSQRLEFWYLIDHIVLDPIVETKFNEKRTIAIEDICLDTAAWAKKCWDDFGDDNKLASCILIHVIQKYFSSNPDFKKALQTILHELKTLSLRIRLNASDIKRLREPGDYLSQCQDYYIQVNHFLEKDVFAFLFYIQDLVGIYIDNNEYIIPKGSDAA